MIVANALVIAGPTGGRLFAKAIESPQLGEEIPRVVLYPFLR